MKTKPIYIGPQKTALTARLRKIKNHLEAIEKMVEAGADVSQVLLRAIRARRALQSLSQKLIARSLHQCVQDFMTPEYQHELSSVLMLLKRYVA